MYLAKLIEQNGTIVKTLKLDNIYLKTPGLVRRFILVIGFKIITSNQTVLKSRLSKKSCSEAILPSLFHDSNPR